MLSTNNTKTAIMLIVLLASVSAPARAQTGGHIGMYTDNGSFTDCELHVTYPGLYNIYVVHQLTDATASEFKLVDYGTALSFIGFTPAHTSATGDLFAEIVVSYDGACPHVTPILIGTLAYYNPTPPVDCSTVWVGGGPTAGAIIAVGCDGVRRTATAGHVTVNPDESCISCAVLHDQDPTPIESTTWGRIKSIYD